MTISSQDIDDFFGRYAAALTNFDAGASADLWATPGTIVDDRFSGVLDSRDAMVSGLEQSYPVYKQLGLASVGYEIVDERPFSDRLVLVAVRWTFSTRTGTPSRTATPPTSCVARIPVCGRPYASRPTTWRSCRHSPKAAGWISRPAASDSHRVRRNEHEKAGGIARCDPSRWPVGLTGFEPATP
ncbi:hypothetical protein [Dermacoccus barathri]|uniref:SnoaL-like domain-containing protein n=1 Tax=Dermacoccus barathri TaxID=322601 RepID=A0ABN2B9K3_9MICO